MWPSLRCLNARCSNQLVSCLCYLIFRRMISTSQIVKHYRKINGPGIITYLCCSVLRCAFRSRQFTFSTFPAITAILVTSTVTSTSIHYACARNSRINVVMMRVCSGRQLMLWSMWGQMMVLYLGEQLFSKSLYMCVSVELVAFTGA